MAKIYYCVDCGLELPRKDLNRHHRCQDCRIKISRDNMQQLRSHDGPHYEKWKQALKAAAQKL